MILSQETINNIDPEIKDFIITLNKIEGIETFSCCSGHNTESHINFRYNKSPILKKVLKFLEKQGFMVKLIVDTYPEGSLAVRTSRHYSVKADLLSKKLTTDKISRFWDSIESKLLKIKNTSRGDLRHNHPLKAL